MNWFNSVFGFKEDFRTVKDKIEYLPNEKAIRSKNNRKFQVGEFTTPSVQELREKVANIPKESTPALKINHVVISDIYNTHQLEQYKGALFQVASQFNCLEFVSPNVTPENGITGYYYDNTQGPSCCLATPAGTLFRNYFATTPQGNSGQTEGDQLNNLDDLEVAVNNKEHNYWRVRNGYTESSEENLEKFCSFSKSWSVEERDNLLSKIKIGLHLHTEVDDINKPDAPKTNIVSQAFCSALSIGYSLYSSQQWEPLARLVLDAMYEATLLSSVINSQTQEGSNIVVLTYVGGGVFGNDMEWIIDAICRACARCSHYNLEVQISHFRSINPANKAAIDSKYARYLNENS